MKRQAVWDPLATWESSRLASRSSCQTWSTKEPFRQKGGRPRVEGRGRLVLYLDEQQIYKLKRDALESAQMFSALAREVLRKAGY